MYFLIQISNTSKIAYFVIVNNCPVHSKNMDILSYTHFHAFQTVCENYIWYTFCTQRSKTFWNYVKWWKCQLTKREKIVIMPNDCILTVLILLPFKFQHQNLYTVSDNMPKFIWFTCVQGMWFILPVRKLCSSRQNLDLKLTSNTLRGRF